MSSLDSNTVVVLGLALHTALALMMVLTYFTRKTYPGFKSWTFGLLSWAFTGMALYFRPVLGDVATLVLGGLSFDVFGILLHSGMCRFYGLKNWRKLMAQDIAVAGAVMCLVLLNFFTLHRSEIRVFINSSLGCFFLVRAASAPFKAPLERRSFIQLSLSASLLLAGVLLALRAVVAMKGAPYSGLLPGDPLFKGTLVAGLFVDVLLVYSFISLVHVRMERELTEATARLEDLANSDALTGLANRRHLTQTAGHDLRLARRYNRPISFILFDLDHFKEVNDTFGHAAGDVVLTTVAKRSLAILRDTDILSRWGGEEFALLMPETTLDDAVKTAERLRGLLREYPLNGDGVARATASFGVAQSRGESFEKLAERADKALYRAKREGRDRVCAARNPA